MRALLPLAVVLTLAVAPIDGHAQWKWRDAQGRVTVSDRPPPQDVPAKDILSRPPGAERKAATPTTGATDPGTGANAPATTTTAQAATNGTGARAGGDPELEARRKKLEQERADRAKAPPEVDEKQAAAMRDNCERARAHMATLDSGQRVARSNEKGEREVLDDTQRAAEAARTREIIATNCK